MQYYKRHKQALNIFYNNLDRLASQYACKKEWIMFGSSRISGMIISYLRTKGIQVSAIIDNDSARQGETAFQVNIYGPENLLCPYRNNALILIASAHQEAMIEQLAKLGYEYGTDVVKVIDLPKLMNQYNFEDRSGYKKMTLSECKRHQLDILDYLQNLCQKHGLHYCISGGTLIGAVRHKGYIPWDDDIDIVMEIKDLMKLSEILKNDKRYKLISMFDDELDYFDDCSLLVDTETIMDMNRFPIQSTTGVSIDIFLLTGIPDGQAGKDYMVKARQLETQCYNTLYSYSKCRNNIKILIDYLLQYDFYHYKKAGAVLGSYFYKEILDQADYAEHIEMPFEDRIFWAPKGYEHYLTQIFGDYMQLPPKEQQHTNHNFYAYYKNK